MKSVMKMEDYAGYKIYKTFRIFSCFSDSLTQLHAFISRTI